MINPGTAIGLFTVTVRALPDGMEALIVMFRPATPMVLAVTFTMSLAMSAVAETLGSLALMRLARFVVTVSKLSPLTVV